MGEDLICSLTVCVIAVFTVACTAVMAVGDDTTTTTTTTINTTTTTTTTTNNMLCNCC